MTQRLLFALMGVMTCAPPTAPETSRGPERADTERHLVLFEGARVDPEVAARACAERPSCAEDGVDCVPIGGRCRNPEGFDCSASLACTSRGRCRSLSRDLGGRLATECHLSEEHCASTAGCADHGWCGARLLQTEHDGCTRERCDVDYALSRCDKTEAGCAASNDCVVGGQCGVSAPFTDYCHPTEERHCTESVICKDHGYCTLAEYSSFMMCSK